MFPIIIFIMVFVFAVWSVWIFYEIAVMAVINLILGGIVILRMIHDLRDRKNIALYLLSTAVIFSLVFIRNLIGLEKISRFVSRFMVLEAVQILLAIFLIAQVLIFIKNSKLHF